MKTNIPTRSPIRKRAAGLVAALAASALLFAGCTGSGGPGGGAASGASGGGDSLTFVPNYNAQGLDISKYPLEIGVNIVVSQVLEPLVRFDGKTTVPVLAESWNWTDPTTLVFKLRQGVTFSDGQPLTAKDVVGSLDRYIAAKQALATSLAMMASYEATDDSTVTIKTKAPTGTLVGILSMIYIGEGSHSTDDAWWVKPIGTGPFVFQDFVVNDHVTMVRNDKYWGEKAKLKTLTIKQIPDVNSKITALANGEAQVIQDVPHDQIAQVKGMDNIAFTQADSLNYWFLWFNNAHKPLDDVRVRKAMVEALDLPTIISSLYGDTVKAMDSFCPSSAFGCLPAALPKYNPDDAKKLLADAGHADGFTIDIIFNTANAGVDNLVQTMISQWKAIGVTVKPRALDSTTWLADFNGLNWDMDTQPNQTITGDADYTLNRLYSCAAKRLGYCNPDQDKLMTQAQQSTDQAERQRLYQQVADMMAKELPAIPLFQLNVNVAATSKVQGLSIPPTEFIDFSKVSLAA